MNIDLPRSWMIGDQESDVLAGQRAGCHTIHIDPRLKRVAVGNAAGDLLSAVEMILGQRAVRSQGKVA